MNCVTIKHHRADGVVAVETYDTDTDAVSGLSVRTSDLWRWLWQRRPCQVDLSGRLYALHDPAALVQAPVLEGWTGSVG